MQKLKRKFSDVASHAITDKEPRKRQSIVEKVNGLSSDTFKERYLPDTVLKPASNKGDNTHDISLTFKNASELEGHELKESLGLIESTSRHDYERSSIGWNPRRKKREMMEEEMRYLLVRCDSQPCQQATSHSRGSLGFLSFMLTHDSTPSVPVLYIYEIHLPAQHQKQGIGQQLMRLVEEIAVAVGVEKVMLTCFLHNEKAHGFYHSIGYETDVCSPQDRKTRNKVVKSDYVIMSKEVGNKPPP